MNIVENAWPPHGLLAGTDCQARLNQASIFFSMWNTIPHVSKQCVLHAICNDFLRSLSTSHGFPSMNRVGSLKICVGNLNRALFLFPEQSMWPTWLQYSGDRSIHANTRTPPTWHAPLKDKIEQHTQKHMHLVKLFGCTATHKAACTHR